MLILFRQSGLVVSDKQLSTETSKGIAYIRSHEHLAELKVQPAARMS